MMSAVGGAQGREVNSTSCCGGSTPVLPRLPSEIKKFHESVCGTTFAEQLKTFGKGEMNKLGS